MPPRTRRVSTRSGGVEGHTIYLSNLNWLWAKMQPGRNGASGYIDRLVDRERRRGEDSLLKKQARKLRIRIAKLEGMVVQLGGDPHGK